MESPKESLNHHFTKGVMDRMKKKRLTKIIGTLTVDSNRPELLEQLFLDGVDSMRVFLDHGFAESKIMIQSIRTAERKCGVLVPIILEQRNSKRIYAKLPQPRYQVKKGTEFTIFSESQPLTEDFCMSINFPSFSFLDKDTKYIVLLDMGKLSAMVTRVEEHYIKCVMRCDGTFFDKTVIHILNAHTQEAVELPCKKTEDQYLEDLEFAIESDIDYILVNGLENTDGLVFLRKHLDEKKSKIKIMAKVDSKWSSSEIESYIDMIDGIVIARSELGIKMRSEIAFWLQKPIIHKCNMRAIPCIEASHFLDSVAGFPQPTCAETTDIYMAVIEGYDGLMFSKEILYGKYPINAIKAMHDICCIAEEKFDYSSHYVDLVAKTSKPFDSLEAISSSAVSTAFNMKSPAMIALTERGRGTRYLSKYKPYATVLALCGNIKVAHQCALLRSIFPLFNETPNLEDPIRELIEKMKEYEILHKGQNIILYSGLKEEKTGTENVMKAIQI